jgi:uncharacterized integral membrane protein
MKHKKLYFALAIAVIGFVLGYQNSGYAEITLLFFSFQLPLVLVVALCLLAGFIVGYVVRARKGARRQARQSTAGKPAKNDLVTASGGMPDAKSKP